MEVDRIGANERTRGGMNGWLQKLTDGAHLFSLSTLYILENI